MPKALTYMVQSLPLERKHLRICTPSVWHHTTQTCQAPSWAPQREGAATIAGRGLRRMDRNRISSIVVGSPTLSSIVHAEPKFKGRGGGRSFPFLTPTKNGLLPCHAMPCHPSTSPFPLSLFLYTRSRQIPFHLPPPLLRVGKVVRCLQVSKSQDRPEGSGRGG